MTTLVDSRALERELLIRAGLQLSPDFEAALWPTPTRPKEKLVTGGVQAGKSTLVPAEWRVGIDDDPDTFMYLCSACLESALGNGPRGLVLERFEEPDPEAVIPIQVDAEVWSLLSERQLRLTREQRRLVSLNDTVKDLLTMAEAAEKQ